MILNISHATGEFLLAVVDLEAEIALKEVKKAKGARREEWVRVIHHLGLLKHRLEYGLGRMPVFIGPKAWGFPLHGVLPK